MIIATVIFIECNGSGCQTIIALKDAATWREFEATWHNGKRYDFCPNCRFTSAAQLLISQDTDATATPLQITFEDGLAAVA